MIEIDGSAGEGGGQILRTSLGLSMATGKPFRITNVRAGRAKPGLLRQHLTAVHAAAAISSAEVSGDALGSRELTFVPGPVKNGEYTFAVGTAGSTMLVLQAVLPALLVADGPTSLALEGGTHNPFAPPFDFLDKAFLPLVNRMGARVDAALERYGFAPAGGGRALFRVTPAAGGKLGALELRDRGAIVRPACTSHLAALPDDIAHRELSLAQRMFAEWPADAFQLRRLPTDQGPGNLFTIEIGAEHVTELFTGFGQRGTRAEAVAEDAIQQAKHYLAAGVPVGKCLADQLLVPMSLGAGGTFTTQGLTRHATTNIDVIRGFIDVEITTEQAGRDRVVVMVSKG